MRTIRAPILPPKDKRVYHLTCSSRACQAVLEVAHEELRCIEDRNESLYQFDCPHCNKTVSTSGTFLPRYIVVD